MKQHTILDININIYKTKYKINALKNFLKQNEGKKGLIIFKNSKSAFVIFRKFLKDGYDVGYKHTESGIGFIDTDFYKLKYETVLKYKNQFDFIFDYNFLEDMETYIKRLNLIKNNGLYEMVYSNRDIILIKEYSFKTFPKKEHRFNLKLLGELNWYIYTSNSENFLENIKKYINENNI